MNIDVSHEITFVIERCKEIAEREDVNPGTKIDALKLIGHTIEFVAGLNLAAQRMQGMGDVG